MSLNAAKGPSPPTQSCSERDNSTIGTKVWEPTLSVDDMLINREGKRCREAFGFGPQASFGQPKQDKLRVRQRSEFDKLHPVGEFRQQVFRHISADHKSFATSAPTNRNRLRHAGRHRAPNGSPRDALLRARPLSAPS
jgi:hypothetical protein